MSYQELVDSEQSFRTGFLEWNVMSDDRLEAYHPLYGDNDGSPLCCVITKVDDEFKLSGEFAPAHEEITDLSIAIAIFENSVRNLIVEASCDPLHECHRASKRLLDPAWKRSGDVEPQPPTVDVVFRVEAKNHVLNEDVSPSAVFEPVNDHARVMQMTPMCSMTEISIKPSSIRLGTLLTIRMQG